MHRMLIDGKLVAADRTCPSVNPATGQVLDQAPEASVADARAAIAAARHAFDSTSWSTDVAFRARCLDQLHQALTEHAEELRELTIADVGAPRVITRGAQLDGVVRYAESDEMRVVVIGHHRHSRIARFFLGSTTDRVSEH